MGSFNQILNLKYENNSNLTMITALLLFYLLIANNHLQNLYSGQLNDYIQQNRWIQHLIGYIMMLVIIIIIAGVKNVIIAALYAIIAYGWFILTTKLSIGWNIVIFGLLLIGFLYETILTDKEDKLKSDDNLTIQEVKKIKQKNNNSKKIILLTVLAVTIIGTIIYTNKKLDQYGGNFDADKFLFNPRNK